MRSSSKLVLALIAAVALSAFWPVESFAQEQPTRGQFLVADPSLDRSRFARTVLLVIRHDEERSIAVMVNRPTNVSPATLFPDSSRLAEYDGPVYLGGPVAPSVPLLLFRENETNVEGSVRILGDVFAHSDLRMLEQLDADAMTQSRFRMFVGLAEWGPGQLANELAAGSWDIVTGTASQVFSLEPLDLWDRMRLGGDAAVVNAVQPAADTGSGSLLRSALR